MPSKIIKKAPPAHVVVVDTNALIPSKTDRLLVVAPGFEAAWTSYIREFDLALVVPDVVRGEIIFRQAKMAQEAIKSATGQLETLSKLAEKSYKHKASPGQAKADVERRFDRWLTRVQAAREPTPVAAIDWAAIVDAAIWRKRTFIDDTTEKGFRDVLILEALTAVCNREAGKATVAFITGDTGLLTAARAELDGSCTFYSKLDELGSYLRLFKENSDAEFIKTIQRRATEKFFRPGEDGKGLVYTGKALERIKEKFPEQFKLKAEPAGLLAAFSLEPPAAPTTAWEVASRRNVLVGAAEFERPDKGKIYHWKSPILMLQLFKQKPPSTEWPGFAGLASTQQLNPLYGQGTSPYGISPGGTGSTLSALAALPPRPESRRVYRLEFAARWAARVKNDGRFYDPKLLDVDFVSASFEEATEEDLRRFQAEN